MPQIGVSVHWAEPGSTAIPGPERAELLVYLRAGGAEKIGLSKTVMGAVLDKRTPQRVLFVFLPAVARATGVRLGGMLSAEDERRLAKALGQGWQGWQGWQAGSFCSHSEGLQHVVGVCRLGDGRSHCVSGGASRRVDERL